jgi:hypothetical protein
MTSSLKALVILCLAVATGGAQALEIPLFGDADAPRADRRHPAPGQEQARNDSAMQAVCREILVDTDEGYGVTNRESRVICDQLR